MIAVQTHNLTKTFGPVTAVDDIHLEIQQGSVVGVIGPDGAGKTTLLRLLTGLLKSTSGSISVVGTDVVKNPQELKKDIGYMPQHFSLYGDLTVTENLKFFADMYSVSRDVFDQRKKELLAFSGLTLFQNRLARNLSGGMQKKLALASNLLHTPKILFLDEPTTGVDPVSRQELWDILFQLNKQGVTLILTTPYMDEAQRCQRVGFMYDGRILSFRSPQDLIREMKEEVVELVTPEKRAKKILMSLPSLINMYPFGRTLHLTFGAGELGTEKTRALLEKHGIETSSIKKITPSFEDVFLNLILKQDKIQENDPSCSSMNGRTY
jgi:ABC-2 type transport system ATP-binding protein